ncbi:Uma2 family endonuclease [Cryptosporangium phraense]|nr:Uma2 family endonuclease [Cryptosporangium phraense]
MSAESRYSIPLPVDGRWTNDFLDALPYDLPYRIEIVDGNLVVSPRPHHWHLDVAVEVRNALVAAAPPGVWAYVEPEVRWAGGDGDRVEQALVPDVTVAPRALRSEEAPPYSRPEVVQLVVEVVSPSSIVTDREHKPRYYAALGIPAMWRIDRGLTLTEYRLSVEGGPEIVRTVEGGKFTTDVPFPVTLDLDSLG